MTSKRENVNVFTIFIHPNINMTMKYTLKDQKFECSKA